MDVEPSIVGEPINRLGFIYAPTNKVGVGLFFGRVAERLQMQIEEARPSAPHCVARRQIARGWEQVTLVFAYQSSELQAGAPNLRPGTLIVCWQHDGPECPLEVIELRAVGYDTGPIPAGVRGLSKFQSFVERQSERTRRLFHHLDQGVQALASDIVARATKGRKGVGGVSYYAPELRFCYIDFRRTGRGLTFYVFTGGHAWAGVSLSTSAPWGSLSVLKEADLPKALTLAKAACDAIKRAKPHHKPNRRKRHEG